MNTRALASGGFGLLTLTLVACNSTSSVGSMTGGSGGGSSGAGGSAPLTRATKIDMLLVVDNSRSMADKQELLASAVVDLTNGLVNPACVDESGFSTQPASPLDSCPPGAEREFAPIQDIHMGLISSSLGGHGSDSCSTGSGNASNDDRGHLLTHVDVPGGGSAPTYQSKGFLAWDPTGSMNPPGESDYSNLVTTFRDMVLGVGQIGCGYESVLESWYRFLVDPAPYDTIAVDNQPACADPDPSNRPDTCGQAVPQGIDQALLDQRAGFLRPDSMLVVVMLSDENDCSTIESGQFYLSNQLSGPGGPFHLPKGRAICQTDPNSACCRSCGQPAGQDENGNDCPDDPTCGAPPDDFDDANLRCFDQKRRFGIDFLYPTDRYVQALTQATIADAQGNLVPNPIFSDLDPSDDNDTIRDPGLVVLTGILGVPWQDLARDPSDLDEGFKSAAELAEVNGGASTWDVILGDPESYVAPLDPLMQESVAPRSGSNPVTGDALMPPGSPAGSNPINGHEYSIPGQNDLQYACIMPLLAARDCGPGNTEASCDCSGATLDNPLCMADPGTGDTTLQVRAKAYPGLRQLSVLKGMGDQAVVTSICASEVDDISAPSFGYRPALASVLERVKPRL